MIMGWFDMICPNCRKRELPHNGVCKNCGYDHYIGITEHVGGSSDRRHDSTPHRTDSYNDEVDYSRLRFDTASLDTHADVQRFVKQLRRQNYTDEEIIEGFSHSPIDVTKYL